MENKLEKNNLRKILLEKRDGLSYDFIKLASNKIHENLQKLEIYKKAKSFGSYFPIGSEVKTEKIMEDAIKEGKTVSLPKVVGKNLDFRKIRNFDELEKRSFEILEPKDSCPPSGQLDVVLVPTVAIARTGIRLGYGYGYYDRFLSQFPATAIALTYSKQIVKFIPSNENDVRIDFIVTEEEYIKTSKK